MREDNVEWFDFEYLELSPAMHAVLYHDFAEDEVVSLFGVDPSERIRRGGPWVLLPNAILCLCEVGDAPERAHFRSATRFRWVADQACKLGAEIQRGRESISRAQSTPGPLSALRLVIARGSARCSNGSRNGGSTSTADKAGGFWYPRSLRRRCREKEGVFPPADDHLHECKAAPVVRSTGELRDDAQVPTTMCFVEETSCNPI